MQAMANEQPAPWEVASYDDEAGFERRIAATLPALAETTFAERSKAVSTCPDTGQRVRTWALEGETIYSPYTGRAYKQGETGYFGPRARDDEGRITAFGGDPLKYDLPPATAYLMKHPGDVETKAFLSIPGNLNQQYHFAAANWARFLGLAGEQMDDDWHAAFQEAVADYREQRRPSDGPDREHAAMESVHDLVGEEGELLGGNVRDGGTENHKTMWRTSGLLYAQKFGPDAIISGHRAEEAERLITHMIAEYLELSFEKGNGEYDSSIYYPHSIRGFLNLYDFSPDPQTRELAKAALDFYYLTYGLKVFNGNFTGPQKRGFVDGFGLGEMDTMLWSFFPETTQPMPESEQVALHLVTSDYRPNRIIRNIVTKQIDLPFEARIARPTYHLRTPNAFQETFYCSRGFALGSIAMTMVDNPGQQTIWALNARAGEGSFILGGGHPDRIGPIGHSPYDQVIQKRGAMVMVTGQTGEQPDGEPDAEQQRRFEHATDALAELPLDAPAAERVQRAGELAETWVYIPRNIDGIMELDGSVYIEAGDAFIAIRPLVEEYGWLRTSKDDDDSAMQDLARYDVLVIPGDRTGFVLDAADRADHASFDAFVESIERETSLDASELVEEGIVRYRSLAGDELEMAYQPTRLRAEGRINGEPIDWSNWAGGGVYESPYLRIGDGKLKVTDGDEGYSLAFEDGRPVYRHWDGE